jgi:hypothetical protein
MPFQKMQWLSPIAVTFHNSEEAVCMTKWVAVTAGSFPYPGAIRILFALPLLTLAASPVTYLSAQIGNCSIWAYLLFGYAVAMLVYLLIPHIPATLVFGEYTPDVVTAVLINLPIMNILLFKAVREQWVWRCHFISPVMRALRNLNHNSGLLQIAGCKRNTPGWSKPIRPGPGILAWEGTG